MIGVGSLGYGLWPLIFVLCALYFWLNTTSFKKCSAEVLGTKPKGERPKTKVHCLNAQKISQQDLAAISPGDTALDNATHKHTVHSNRWSHHSQQRQKGLITKTLFPSREWMGNSRWFYDRR